MNLRTWCLAPAVLLAACGSEPFHEDFLLNTENQTVRSAGLALDARQRVILAHEIDSSQSPSGQIHPHQIVCAEPSPDVATALAEAFSLGLDANIPGTGQAGAALGAASTESLIELGRRTATVQLMRDLLYRACEAYANGAVSATGYAVMLSAIDEFAATLFLAEAAAGTTGGRGAIIKGGKITTEGDVEIQNIVEGVSGGQDAEQAGPGSQTAAASQSGGSGQSGEPSGSSQGTPSAGATGGGTEPAASGTADVGKAEGVASKVTAKTAAEEIARIHDQFMNGATGQSLQVACIVAMDRRIMGLTTDETYLEKPYKITETVTETGDDGRKTVETTDIEIPVADISTERVTNDANDNGTDDEDYKIVTTYSIPKTAVATPLVNTCKDYMSNIAQATKTKAELKKVKETASKIVNMINALDADMQEHEVQHEAVRESPKAMLCKQLLLSAVGKGAELLKEVAEFCSDET